MARLLTFFMILALVTTQGSSMAAAVCRHQNAQEHSLARQSRDPKVASVSLREDAAAAASTKKTTPSGDSSGHWPAQLLPSRIEAPALPAGERLPPPPSVEAALPSATILPLLEPPSA